MSDRATQGKLLAAWGGLYAQAYAHLAAQHPAEGCGLLVRRGRRTVYWPCRNAAALHQAQDRFVVHPEDWAAAEDAGTVLAVVHSHPDDDAHPSEADRWLCHASGLPWFIVAVPGPAWQPLWPEPLPLLERQFVHGVVDCYTLVRDYYARELGIELPDFERADDWWNHGGDLYRQNFGAAGFAAVEGEPRLHDVLLMQVAARVPNHAAVWVGSDPAMPGTAPRILHHLYGRLSGHDVWGGDWARRTTAVLRHRSLA